MRRSLTLAAVMAVVVAACSPAEDALTSTSLPATTTSSSPSTTVLAPTTTLTSTTSTTIPATTTSTVEASTTTESAGNWADLPLVVAGFGALGWWDGGSWVSAEDAGVLPVAGGEDYQVAGIGFDATTTGGPQVIVCEPLDNIGVELANDDLLGEWPGPYTVAISAPWDLQPHLFEPARDDGTYAGIAAGLLAERGLNVANPVIKQLFRTDLEGDGTNEVLVVAEDISGGYDPQVGDYSMLFMRKVVQGDVQTAVLGDTVITDVDGAFIEGFAIGSVADLSGDGKMEIVVSIAYYEGLGVEVWEYANDDLGLISVIGAGCGS